MESSEVSPEGCIIEKSSIYSKCMGREIKSVVVLPPEYKNYPNKLYPILYTLHGKGAPYNTWSEMSPLRNALKDKPMIVTCFDGDNASMYLDSDILQTNYLRIGKGQKKPDKVEPVKSMFTTFFFDEFVPCIDKNYRVNPKQRMITGFSMGGFGAFHYMLTKPDFFVSVSSLSGAFMSIFDAKDEKQVLRIESLLEPLLGPINENRKKYEEVDIYFRIKKYAENKQKLPLMFLHCGTEDPLVESGRKFKKFLEENGYTCKYLETPGKHDWTFWKGASKGIIDFHWESLK